MQHYGSTPTALSRFCPHSLTLHTCTISSSVYLHAVFFIKGSEDEGRDGFGFRAGVGQKSIQMCPRATQKMPESNVTKYCFNTSATMPGHTARITAYISHLTGKDV